MALTKNQIREILSEAACPEGNIESASAKILDGHLTSINALREKADEYKADAEKLVAVQKELDDEKAKNSEDWHAKYDAEHASFEDYKAKTANEKAKAQKVSLYKSLLAECGVEDKRIDAVLKVSDIDALEIKDGKLENVDALKESINSEWSGFIVTPKTKTPNVDNPPANNGDAGKKPESRAAQFEAAYHKERYGNAEMKGEK